MNSHAKLKKSLLNPYHHRLMEMKTQMQQSPPGGILIAGAFEGDEIEDIGERIARLSPQQARSLGEYLDARGATGSRHPIFFTPNSN